ncbi:hypothetical protein PG984_014054 [Apiospora sp. TS-2023a]
MDPRDGDGVAALCEYCKPALRLPCLPSKNVVQNEAGEKPGRTDGWIDTAGDFCTSSPEDLWWEDEWPGLPVIEASIRETGCDFCRFLKAALSSREAKQWLDDNGLENLRLSRRWVAQTDKPVTAWLFQILVWDADYDYDEEPPWGNGLLVLSFPVTSKSRKLSIRDRL